MLQKTCLLVRLNGTNMATTKNSAIPIVHHTPSSPHANGSRYTNIPLNSKPRSKAKMVANFAFNTD